MFIGTGMLAPIVARPMSSILGRPLAGLLGTAGKLGRENAMRTPRRTAQTAAALMVGLALVSTMAVYGASLSRSATSSVVGAISADFIINSTSSSGGVSSTVAPAIARLPGVAAASTVYRGPFEIQGSLATLTAVSPAHLPETVILAVTAGRSAPALAAGQLLVDTTTANSKHLAVGSVVPVIFAQTGSSTMRIGGIFKPNSLVGSFVVADSFFLSHFDNPLPIAVLVRADGEAGQVGKALERGLAAYPELKIQTRSQFEASQQAQVNQLLGLVYALLALAVHHRPHRHRQHLNAVGVRAHA